MTKPKMTRLLIDLLIPNLLCTVVYMALLTLLNVVSEGKLVMSTGALVAQGWSASDVPPAIQIALTIAILVFDAIVLGLFFVFSYIRLSRYTSEKEVFLAEIATSPYDVKEGQKTYMHRRGWRSLFFFGGVLLGLLTAEEIGLPFATLLITPQTLITHDAMNLLPLSMATRRVMIFVLTALLNIGLYAVYQWLIPHRVYARWAGERMRVISQ